ncbi:MAG: hypothetical protein C4567_12845 [Deltaproteobacteria bacterium]|nr:MAG: hypothetical protein C4567_12845 [Deltaproteobacteria bacterium]
MPVNDYKTAGAARVNGCAAGYGTRKGPERELESLLSLTGRKRLLALVPGAGSQPVDLCPAGR